ncbi:MAG: PQQ-binding-like beta-propeller repeat protein [Proteobacteria bacterium]|nr:PQQ-binding-like beta-propeller repeat protein [Pseudomonadota bacterium]
MLILRWSLCVALTGLAALAWSAAPPHPGLEVYQQHCAVCHDNPSETRAPPLSALQQMDERSLRDSLRAGGTMEAQGKVLDRAALFNLVDFLAMAKVEAGEWLSGMMCSEDRRSVNLAAPHGMLNFGVDVSGHRRLSAAQAGVNSAQMGQLELAWAIGFPNTTQLRTSPVIIGKTMFYSPVTTGTVLAFDLEQPAPCVKWVHSIGTAGRTSLSYGLLDGKPALTFADRQGVVHALDAATGALLWSEYAPHSQGSRVTGAPVIHANKVVVNISGSGVGRAMDPNYECCVEHGSVTALDGATGTRLWTWHTMVDASYTGEVSRSGVKLRGPSGAPIWSTPTIDAKRNLVYVTTGENTSLPATDSSDAVIALDLDTGKRVWGFQALPNDVWNMSCRTPWESSGPNCPPPDKSVLKDHDFGAQAILTQTADGSDILLAGQKSGDVWALNPDTGDLIWNVRFGQGTPLGGIHWGIAIDDERVFATIYDPALPGPESVAQPGLYAVDISTGKLAWQHRLEPDCSAQRQERFAGCSGRFGLSAAPLVVDNTVLAAGADGRFYAFAADTGEIVWQFDTLTDFKTINGVEGKGGSIDSHSIFAGAGLVFVGSGYGMFGQPAGNVLLAFKPAATPEE